MLGSAVAPVSHAALGVPVRFGVPVAGGEAQDQRDVPHAGEENLGVELGDAAGQENAREGAQLRFLNSSGAFCDDMRTCFDRIS